MPLEILIATTNAGKSAEFREMLADSRFAWSDLSQLAKFQVEETGRTFRANASLKASAYAKHFETWALADDSGLEVEALANKPGVFSARWAEMHSAGTGDAANNELLLKQLHGVSDSPRAARFVCCLALADVKGRIILTAQDVFPGRIIDRPRGNGGFGYDPLFLSVEHNRTSAELEAKEKNRVSHRGRALRRLRKMLDIAIPGAAAVARHNRP